jgi:hypothetical protein
VELVNRFRLIGFVNELPATQGKFLKLDEAKKNTTRIRNEKKKITGGRVFQRISAATLRWAGESENEKITLSPLLSRRMNLPSESTSAISNSPLEVELDWKSDKE